MKRDKRARKVGVRASRSHLNQHLALLLSAYSVCEDAKNGAAKAAAQLTFSFGQLRVQWHVQSTMCAASLSWMIGGNYNYLLAHYLVL